METRDNKARINLLIALGNQPGSSAFFAVRQLAAPRAPQRRQPAAPWWRSLLQLLHGGERA
ncbi:MAG TPA: hypothetical protein VFL54_11655 [Gammaproteobacteria bacterium]|nr:hypothetical protein [Gammaproteobacteria bacterium]